MLPNQIPTTRMNGAAPSQSCVSLLIQEASGLQALTHRFAMLCLFSDGSDKTALARPAHIKKALHDVLESWSKLRNSEFTFLEGCDPTFAQTMNLAFSKENEKVINCFEGMGRRICAVILRGRVPSFADTRELVRFVSNELTDINASIVSAALMIDNASREETEQRAHTDILTGLPNRRALQHFLETTQAADWPDNQATVTHVDLDKFKDINDSLGHAAGDAALQHAARAIAMHAGNGDFLARVGGDEFVIISFGHINEEVLAERADQLIAAISAPFVFNGKTCKIGASVGVALGFDAENDSIDRCILNADMALYNAKNAGRSTYEFFTPSLRTQSENKETLLAQIREGLAAEQFQPFFQPQVEGRTGKLVGLESLARWHHPTRGTLSPFHFLDAARDGGLLEQLDVYLTNKAFSITQGWRQSGIKIPQISINLTGSRLLEVDLVDALLAAATQADLDPSMIGIEILESAMIDDDSQQMIDNLAGLTEAGFKLELDDFGTGHASISNLRNFKVDRIKIDRSFVKDVHLNTDLAKITGAMINLAHSLRVDALAEGVETPEERLVLNALGCDHFQGYGVAQPLPATEIPAWIRRTQNTRKLPSRRMVN